MKTRARQLSFGIGGDHAGALSAAGASVGRVYAVNMAGSALGCALYVPLLRSLGGEGCVLLSGGLALLAATCFLPRRTALTALCGIGGWLLCGLAAANPTAIFSVPVAPSKAMSQHLQRDPSQSVLLTKWDPLCRLDVIGPADPKCWSGRRFRWASPVRAKRASAIPPWA